MSQESSRYEHEQEAVDAFGADLERTPSVIGKRPRGDTTDVEGFLLVDDGDGQVLGQFTDAIEALRVLDLLELESPELARTLCLVRFDQRQGSVIGIETSTRFAPLA